MVRRHKWNFMAVSGVPSACVKCGCVRERIGGKWTYFINDTVYDEAGKCKGGHDGNT